MLRILTLALLIALAGPATAQVTGAITPHPKLKELVVVSNDVVRIGDLVENAGSAAGIAVFRSPDLGYTGGVPLARVIEALAPYKLVSLDTGSVTEVMVTRLSRAIPAKEIETRIARALASQFGFGEASNISVTLDNGQRTIHVEPTAADELQVSRLNVDPRTGRFTAVFELPNSVAARRVTLRFNGTAIETAETTILTRSLNRGDVIKDSDVITEKRPKAEIAGEFISTESAIGLAVKRPLRSGTVLRPGDLAKAEVIQRNESVTIVYEVPGVLLTVRGKALEAGAVGDLVGVLNMQSNRTVQAKVSGPGRVVISSGVPLNPTVPAPAANPPTQRARAQSEHHMLKHLRLFFTATVSTGLLAGCSSLERLKFIGSTPPLSGIENPTSQAGYKPVHMPMPMPQYATYNPNSLWRNGSRAFFKDQRAHQVGDILTVKVNITDKATIANETQRSRENKEDSGVDNFFGKTKVPIINSTVPTRIFTGDSSSSSDGKGSINRNETLTTNVAGVVMQVLPNGNLVIEGKQEVRVNFEIRELVVAGIVRPEDIESDNTIDSTKIAEARIAYGGRGQITDVQQPRYGQQVLDVLLPF